MSFVELNNTQFYYEVSGHGQPLVLVHAGIADHTMWDEQVAAFAPQFQTLRYDMRGYGQTPPVDEVYSHAKDLRALLDHLNIQRPYLVGSSFGGATVIEFALQYPERAAGLILSCPALGGYPFSDDEPPQAADIEAALERGDFEHAAELEVQIWVDGSQRTPEQVDAGIRKRIRAANTIALKNEYAEIGTIERLEPPAIQRLNEITIPVLVIIGTLDQPDMLGIASLLERELANVQKIEMSGTAHIPSLERPDEFNTYVLDFLRQQ